MDCSYPMSSLIKRPVDNSGDTSYDRYALLSTVNQLSLIHLPLKLVFLNTVETKLSVMISFLKIKQISIMYHL